MAAVGSNSPISVNIRITTTGSRQATAAMRQVTASAGFMGTNLSRGAVSTRTLGDALRQVGTLMKYTVAGAFMNLGRQAIQLNRQFDLTFSRIKGLVGFANRDIETFRKAVLGLAGETTKAPQELAEALYFITSSGIKDTARALSVLESSAKASAAGLGETRVVADAVTSALNAYGTGAYNAEQATDILTATVREGKAEAETFAPAFSKVLPVAAAFGASFEDVSAAIAALSRGGMTAGTASIYLRQVMTQLLKPSKQAQDALLGVGTSAEQIRQTIQEKGLLVGLQELNTKIGDNPDITAKVFGNVRALTAVLSLLGPAAAENAEIFERLNNSTGDLDYAFAAFEDTAEAKFARAQAASQAALINLGKALQPLITDLLRFGEQLAKIGGAIAGNGLVGPFIRFGGVLVIAVAAMASMIRTASALIRLFSNFGISLQASTLGVRGFTANILQYTTAQGAAAASTATTAAVVSAYAKQNSVAAATVAVMNRATAAGNLSSKVAIGLKIQEVAATKTGILAKLQTIALRKAEKIATDQNNLTTAQAIALTNSLTRSNYLSAAGMAVAAAASRALGVAMRFLQASLGPIMLALTVATTVWSLFSARTRKAGEDAEQAGKNLENLNEILQETVKWTSTGFSLDLDIDVNKKQLETQVEQIKDAFGPEFLADITASVSRNKAFGAAYVKAIYETTFGGLSEATRAAALEALARASNLDPQTIADATIPEGTGDAIADAYIVRVINAFNSSAVKQGGKDAAIDLSQGLFGDFDRAITAALNARTSGGDILTAPFEEMGTTIATIVNETSDLSPLVLTLDQVQQSLERTGTSTTNTNKVLSALTEKALQGLTDGLDLVGDKGGNLAKVLSNADNRAKLASETFQQLGLDSAAVARIFYDDLATQLENVDQGQGGVAEANRIVSEAFRKQLEAAKDLNSGLQSVEGTAKDVADQFSTGLAPQVDAIVDAWDAATKAIANYEKGQEAVMGVGKTVIETNADFRDSLRDLAEASAESGGALLTGSEKADKAQAAVIESAEALLDVVNVYKATGDFAGAAEAFGAGQAQIVATALANGLKQEDVFALFGELGFGPAILATLTDAEEASGEGSTEVGTAITTGLIRGIESQDDALQRAVGKQAEFVLNEMKRYWAIESPSKTAGDEIGKPIAQGIAVGFTKETKSAKFRAAFGGQLAKQIQNALKGGKDKYGAFSAFASKFTEAKGDVKTPVQEFVLNQIERMRDVIGSLGEYLRSQLDFKKAKDDLIKLANTQRLIDDNRRKALRAEQYAARRFGAQGGAQLTDYEQAQIDELQKAFEQASRDYAMGRTTLVEVVDAEIALQEARAAASETSGDVIDAQNSVLDADAAVRDRAEELALAQVQVLEAYTDVQEASAVLYWNSKELPGVFQALATAAGVTSIQLTENGVVIADVGIKFNEVLTSVGVSLTDPQGAFLTALQSLGPNMWEAIKLGVQEAIAKSPLTAVGAGRSGKGGVSGGSRSTVPTTGGPLTRAQWEASSAGKTALASVSRGVGSQWFGRMDPAMASKLTDQRMQAAYAAYVANWKASTSKLGGGATGGPVVGLEPMIVGERGQELFLPGVSGTIVTASALERYVRVKTSASSQQAAGANNQFAINVYNPTPEAASDSISRRMKALASSGLFG